MWMQGAGGGEGGRRLGTRGGGGQNEDHKDWYS
jgi:hypothetical protein